jgi:PIN domain nuclease of toxin-antitoxin system
MLLLDTHVWWWSLSEPENLSAVSRKAIEAAKADERYIASISIWEFAMMVAKQRIELKISPEKWLSQAINNTGISILELTPAIATDSCNLPGQFHNDPADRIIVASARRNNLTLITKDKKILDYSHVKSLW